MALAIRCEEFGPALNALVCVVSYSVRNMPAHVNLLERCISRFDEILRSVSTPEQTRRTVAGNGTDVGSPPELDWQPNFVLKCSSNILMSSGKVTTIPSDVNRVIVDS